VPRDVDEAHAGSRRFLALARRKDSSLSELAAMCHVHMCMRHADAVSCQGGGWVATWLK
jgi:hypothetical protein